MAKVERKRRIGTTRLSGRRQVTLPAAVVAEAGLEPGEELHVEVDDGKIVLSRAGTLAERRRKAIAETAGSMAGVWKPGDLGRLRDEWR